MKILLTNDDGIHAPGLWALYGAVKDSFHVEVVAPEAEMSAVGHAITLTTPLRVQEVNKNGAFFGYAVSGTPADCVKIAVQELIKPPPDLILSGINLGANVGVDVLYSGTVSAATEGAFLGIPSAAISLATLKQPDFESAARFSREVIGFLTRIDRVPAVALNVNVPAVAPEKIQGVCLTTQGTSRYEERYERRTDPRGNVYYWLAGESLVGEGGVNTDSAALKQNKISITPVHYNLTCFEALEAVSSLEMPSLDGIRGSTKSTA